MKVSKEKFQFIMKDCNFIIKRLFCNYYLVRMYGNKQLHPIGYHIIFIMKIKVVE